MVSPVRQRLHLCWGQGCLVLLTVWHHRGLACPHHSQCSLSPFPAQGTSYRLPGAITGEWLQKDSCTGQHGLGDRELLEIWVRAHRRAPVGPFWPGCPSKVAAAARTPLIKALKSLLCKKNTMPYNNTTDTYPLQHVFIWFPFSEQPDLVADVPTHCRGGGLDDL